MTLIAGNSHILIHLSDNPELYNLS